MPDSFWHCTYVSVGRPVSEEPTSPGFHADSEDKRTLPNEVANHLFATAPLTHGASMSRALAMTFSMSLDPPAPASQLQDHEHQELVANSPSSLA